MFLEQVKMLLFKYAIGDITLSDLTVFYAIGNGKCTTTAAIRHAINVDGREQWQSIDRLMIADLVNGDFECSAYSNLHLTEKGVKVLDAVSPQSIHPSF